MPHTATDDYLWQFANLTKALLRPDVKIYVEYSNEVWGTLFPGGIYAQQQGERMVQFYRSLHLLCCFFYALVNEPLRVIVIASTVLRCVTDFRKY